MAQQKAELMAKYLSGEDTGARISFLKTARAHGLTFPAPFIYSILRLEMNQLEKACLITCLDTSTGLPAEEFLTSHLTEWGQETAAAAIRTWSMSTQKVLWHRLAGLVSLPILPQRLKYTLAETCKDFNPVTTISKLIDHGDLAEYSETYHSLLFQRAIEYSIEHVKLLDLAKGILNQQQDEPFVKNRSLQFASIYLARFKPGVIERYYWKFVGKLYWLDGMQALLPKGDQRKVNERIAKALAADQFDFKALHSAWPALHLRHEISQSNIEAMMRLLVANMKVISDSIGMEAASSMVMGCQRSHIIGAMEIFTRPDELRAYMSLAGAFLGKPLGGDQLARLASAFDKDNQDIIMAAFSAEHLPPEAVGKEDYRREQADFAAKKGAYVPVRGRNSPPPLMDLDPELGHSSLSRFLNAKLGQVPTEKGSDFYSRLAAVWTEKQGQGIGEIAAEARRRAGIDKIFYIETLGQLRGVDEAVLKLLDFTRSDKPEELSALIRALAGINTARSKQELVHCLNRPNISHELRAEAASILSDLDLGHLQSDLRSAISDLRRSGNVQDYELSLALTSLLVTEAVVEKDPAPVMTASADASMDIDRELSDIIAEYAGLSTEVKRALRTAKFFNHYLDRSQNIETLDLSPLIDMQYKALELLFRENFENFCFQVIHRGVLQNKLDVIGYARPIPSAMDEFENFIASQPVVRDIPFFSKFKLRKMLRAICQYRPGRRFTLDGLKAFALFFLCFSRSSCRYGLAGLAPIGLPQDQELFEFCRQLHIYQDFRNRAAHEGFHPEVRDDVVGIWKSTAAIVRATVQIQKNIEQMGREPKNKKEPVIVKKVS